MLPKTIALVDDDADYAEYFAQYLAEQGVHVTVFDDSDALISDHSAYDFDFYTIDLSLPGIDGVDLIRILRRRTDAGILVVSGRLTPEAFDAVMQVGADMYLAKPVRFEQVALAIRAVQRRAGSPSRAQAAVWTIDRAACKIITPTGIKVDLSSTDVSLLECFLDAKGMTVSREILREKLGYGLQSDKDNNLHAMIYRLRRRIEHTTPDLLPLQSVAKVGYIFRSKMVSV